MLDDDPQTAWRCSGPGVGTTLTFSFDGETEVGEVGLINGYAKVDPETRTKRYGQYRRITEVVWGVGDLDVRQTLDDDEAAVQTVRIPPQQVSSVTLTIRRTTDPGTERSSSDAVLISEATFAEPA